MKKSKIKNYIFIGGKNLGVKSSEFMIRKNIYPKIVIPNKDDFGKDNVFNKCKSDIKYSEACALGLPLVCQDLEPYKKCKYATKFKTGDEFIDVLKKVTKDESSYVRLSDRCVNEAKDLWLENDKNWKKFEELYIYPYKHKGRKLINSMSENR